ncbi:hypothetical protein [Brevundimonas naejangsanensis]
MKTDNGKARLTHRQKRQFQQRSIVVDDGDFGDGTPCFVRDLIISITDGVIKHHTFENTQAFARENLVFPRS